MPRTKSLSAAAKAARKQSRSVRQREEQASSTTQLPTTSTSPVESSTSSLIVTKRRPSAAVTQPTTTVKATTTGKGLPSSSPGKRRHRSSDFMSTRWRRTYKQHTVSVRARCGATIKQKYRTDRLYRIRFQTRMRLKYTSAVSYHRYWKQKMRQKMPQYMHRRYVTDVRYKTEKRQKMRQHSRTRYATDVEHATEKRQKVRQSK